MKYAYLAAEGFLQQALADIPEVECTYDHLIVSSEDRQSPWVQQKWSDLRSEKIESIKKAADFLKSKSPYWYPYTFQKFRRAALIQEQLRSLDVAESQFLQAHQYPPLGAWSLVADDQIIWSLQLSPPWPAGAIKFEENRIDPPSRAYLKLWELFTRTGAYPQPGEHCVDLGAAPGGWTWVLLEMGAKVSAIDRAPLEQRILAHPHLSFSEQSAFAFQPQHNDPVDWIFSDVICYPERLWTLVQRWWQSGKCKNFVCTLKFQSNADYGIIDKFMSIDNSQVLHLNHNKHELTWVRLEPSRYEF